MHALTACIVHLSFLFVSSSMTGSRDVITGPSTTRMHLLKAVDALEKALLYMNSQLQNLNLDAIIGTRMVSGQLNVLLRHHNDNQEQDFADVLGRLEVLQELAQNISDVGYNVVWKTQPAYFDKLSPILTDGFWELDYPDRRIDVDLIQAALYDEEAIEERDSDDCLAEFFNTGSEKSSKCNISAGCWGMMTNSGYKLYSLTHQVFYLEIGHMYGCHNQMRKLVEQFGQISVDYLESGFCANTFRDAIEIYNTNFQHDRQDLFMEEAALCGMLGFRDFFPPAWLNEIIRMQDESGCYKQHHWFLKNYGRSYMRKIKREEKVLQDECLAHMTTVASAALSQYIRFNLN